MIQIDGGKEIVHDNFTEILVRNIIRRYSRYKSKGAVYIERIVRTIRDFMEKPVFEKGTANMVHKISASIKCYGSTTDSSTNRIVSKKQWRICLPKSMRQKKIKPMSQC